MSRLSDADCAELLAWASPRLELSASGFRRVRGQVRKRIARRMAELGLTDLAGYRRRLEADPAEWSVLDTLCRVTITRFFRDGAVFERLFAEWLPQRARRRARFRILCAGCASGEEPYTLAIAWHGLLTDPPPLEILAVDADPVLLARARAARYPVSAFRELPRPLFAALDVSGGEVTIPDAFRAPITFIQSDVRAGLPAGPFDAVFCRNLAFTYFAPALQERFLTDLAGRVEEGGLLVIGRKESLPAAHPDWTALDETAKVYARATSGATARGSP
jgi:chemotaxis protein methyltransferase CheR